MTDQTSSPDQQLQDGINKAILKGWEPTSIGPRTASMKPVDTREHRIMMLTINDAGKLEYHVTNLPKPKSHRVFMWVVLAINALFAVWLLWYWASIGDTCASETTYREACRTGTSVGVMVGTFMLLAFWALVDIVLGVIYMVTRRPR